MTKTILLLAVLLSATACRKAEPPAPTAEQANQLNDAENMLNESAD